MPIGKTKWTTFGRRPEQFEDPQLWDKVDISLPEIYTKKSKTTLFFNPIDESIYQLFESIDITDLLKMTFKLVPNLLRT